jgi:hypothetical protein
MQHGARPAGAHSLAGGRQTGKLKSYTVVSAFTEISPKNRKRTEQLT